jgi:hypothetical protein
VKAASAGVPSTSRTASNPKKCVRMCDIAQHRFINMFGFQLPLKLC